MNERSTLRSARHCGITRNLNYATHAALLAVLITTTLPVQSMAQSGLSLTPVVFEVTPRERIWDGTVEAINQGTVSAQTSGRVAEIMYDIASSRSNKNSHRQIW